jgi:hypothetical protein
VAADRRRLGRVDGSRPARLSRHVCLARSMAEVLESPERCDDVRIVPRGLPFELEVNAMIYTLRSFAEDADGERLLAESAWAGE